VREAFAV